MNTDFSVGYGGIRLKRRNRNQLAGFHVSSNKDNYR